MIDGNAVDFTMDALNIIEFPKQYIHSQTDRQKDRRLFSEYSVLYMSHGWCDFGALSRFLKRWGEGNKHESEGKYSRPSGSKLQVLHSIA